MDYKKNYAIVLAGGKGSRMESDIPKQYINIDGYPVLYYSLKAFEDFDAVTGVILVTIADDIEYCRREMVNKYNFTKVKTIVAGGMERYDSVCNALDTIIEDNSLVFIHDGARACIDNDTLAKLYSDACRYRNAVAAVTSKDTIRLSDDNKTSVSTPPRDRVWIIQTPQVFNTGEIKKAYNKMKASGMCTGITDDAMVMERFGNEKIHLTGSSYTNIKVTTPDDLYVAENILKNRKKNKNSC